MTTAQTKAAKDNMLIYIATILLRDAPLTREIEKHIKKQNTKLVNHLSKEEYSHYVSCKNIIKTLGEKLISCDDPMMVVKTLAYVEALNTGNVYEAAEGQELV